MPKHPDAKGVIEKVKAMMTAAKLLAQDNRHHAMVLPQGTERGVLPCGLEGGLKVQ